MTDTPKPSRMRRFFSVIDPDDPVSDVGNVVPAPVPARPDGAALEGEVDWEDEPRQGSGDPHWDLIVDFGTAATVILATRPGHDGLEWKFVVGEHRKNPAPGEPDVRSLLGSDFLLHQRRLEIQAVGRDAYDRWTFDQQAETANLGYRVSLKRYIELHCRGASSESSCHEAGALTEMVRGYLLRALRYHGVDVERLPAEASEEIRDQVFRDGSLRVNAASIVSVSVPNSFNHAAAEVIRNGIVQAVEKVWGVRIPRDHVRIIREGAAAAQVAFTEVTGGLHPSFPPDAVPKWRAVLPTGATGATDLDPLALGSGERKLVAVLDVGAGTTDLTIIEATTAGTAVLMNAGVPLGGDDVDRVIIGAVAADPARTERAGVTAKCLAMGRARDHKEQARDPESRLNFSSDQAQQIVADLRVDVDLDPASIAGKCARRLAAVAALSVRGLFGLLPENFALSAVVLSGRGALLPEIGRTVVEVATERGCTDVRTLANAVQLKLAVAYGCGILNDQSSTVFDRLVPTRTLGRVVEVRLNKTPIANIGAFTPVPLRLPLCLRTPVTAPGSLPILDFRVRLDTTARTVLREAEIDPQSQLGAIGLYGHVAHFRVGQHDVRGANPGLLLVFDVEEGGYVTLFAKSVTTCAPDPDPTPIDPISRLPLPFPERVTES